MSDMQPVEGRILPDFDRNFRVEQVLEKYRLEQPQKPALIEGDRSRCWAESVERIYRMANGLIALGVDEGDRVAILSRNSLAYSELFVAVILAGGCAVPMQTLITAEALKNMLEDCGARVLVVSADYEDTTKPFLASQSQLLEGGLLGFDFSNRLFTGLETFMADQSECPPSVELAPDAAFDIMYSSGTTGTPKGIVHSHRIRQGLAKGVIERGMGGESKTLITTPLYSNTTFTTWWPTVCAGGTLIIENKFDAERSLALIQEHEVNAAMFVPVQYDRIMRLQNFDDYELGSMQFKFCTSAPLRTGLKAEIIDRFPGELLELYGLTEGGAGTLFVGSEAKELGKLGSVGCAIPGCVLKIIDEQGNELPQGEIGEIVGRSANMCDGYHNQQQANEEMCWHDSDGLLYYRSGDVGYLDADGWLFLSDRKKDMIISGGFNIYATDLELVLLENPAVHEVAVVAIPSQEWGETPMAVVVREEGEDIPEENLRDWANQRLGKAQRISSLVYTDELPKSSIGKILKKELRATYAGSHAL
jgi:long-chain acyl-CoA synthetase